ncbi:hypothetical protein BJ138DRAFT_1001353 [Hygrophoropsis aurantiaca]|uniref:Uncharacterized protein n=1 Tax=Hygrophoropsis aurantiaca TaxID=72124 RepID=A0ACB8AL72_9AGAM|nr:hypothetical protein BJ138DRAFT_1001353 [Hygrophoropsis aurantiaca]
MRFTPALLIAGAGFATAQTLSSQCESGLASIAGSSEASCLNLNALVQLALSNSSSTSVIPTINTWATGLCSTGACTNQTLSDVVTNITTACSTELQSIGASTTNTGALISAVQQAYPTVRQIACLKDTSTSTLCLTETLTGIQSATTTLSLTNIVGLITKVMSGQTVSIPQNVTCSDCSKAAYTIAAQNFPSLVSGEQSSVSSTCGADFTNGQMPTDVQETASNTTSTGNTGAAVSLSMGSLHMGAAALVAVSSVFAFLA